MGLESQFDPQQMAFTGTTSTEQLKDLAADLE